MQTQLHRFINWVGDSVTLPNDTETIRVRKIAGVLAQLVGILIALFWVVTFIIMGYRQPTMIILFFIALSGGNLLAFTLTKNLTIYANVAIVLLMGMAFGLQISFGGFLPSGMVSVWAIVGPLVASILLSRRSTMVWLVIFITATAVVAALETEISQLAPNIPIAFSIVNGVMNISLTAVLVVVTNLYLLAQLDEARERADHLLLNILPAPIAKQLKRQPGTIADGHPEVTVLFADIVGFTQMSANANPVDVVNMLNTIFSEFDGLAAKHGLEKIKTIGDAYMVAGGLPGPRDDHAEAVVEMAIDMLDILKNFRAWNGESIRVRVGINTGPVVAGVIGRQKFIYDLWGDAVNTASRMESNGMANVIQVTEATYYKLREHYLFEERKPIHIKGKGQMVTYLLKGRISLTGA